MGHVLYLVCGRSYPKRRCRHETTCPDNRRPVRAVALKAFMLSIALLFVGFVSSASAKEVSTRMEKRRKRTEPGPIPWWTTVEPGMALINCEKPVRENFSRVFLVQAARSSAVLILSRTWAATFPMPGCPRLQDAAGSMAAISAPTPGISCTITLHGSTFRSCPRAAALHRRRRDCRRREYGIAGSPRSAFS